MFVLTLTVVATVMMSSVTVMVGSCADSCFHGCAELMLLLVHALTDSRYDDGWWLQWLIVTLILSTLDVVGSYFGWLVLIVVVVGFWCDELLLL